MRNWAMGVLLSMGITASLLAIPVSAGVAASNGVMCPTGGPSALTSWPDPIPAYRLKGASASRSATTGPWIPVPGSRQHHARERHPTFALVVAGLSPLRWAAADRSRLDGLLASLPAPRSQSAARSPDPVPVTAVGPGYAIGG